MIYVYVNMKRVLGNIFRHIDVRANNLVSIF